MNPVLLVLLLAFVLAAAAFADRPAGAPATRSVVYGRRGMVACAHPLASQIGVDVLKRGGTAVDAAIAMNAALGFLEPMSCGIGGDLFALVWDAKGGKLHGLNGSGRCPKALTVERVKPNPDGTIPLYSPFAWTVPGAVDGWFELHGKFGKLPMADLLAPAIRAAAEGEPVPEVMASDWLNAEPRMKGTPGFADVFLPGGRAPREGEVFRNPALARAYEAIAKGGRDAYYRGPIAEAVVSFSRKHGGFFAPEDFAGHRSEWVEPVSTDYRGVTVYEIPPNGQGLAALQMLNLLETFDLKGMGRDSADFWHVMAEAKKLAFEDRAKFYADPAFAKVPVAGLLAKSYARDRAKLIDPKRASERLAAGSPPEHGDTTYLCAADAEGNMVSLIQSNYTGFGSGHAVPEWGFGLQSRGGCFNLTAGHANRLEPGKRPFHTIIPAFATRGGKPWLAFGVMGGSMQPQGHVQIMVNLVDFGMNLQAAGDAPRYRHQGGSDPDGTRTGDGGTLALESGLPAEVLRELERRGHRLATGGSFGGYQAVARDPVTGVYAGASESRKDGCALGF